MSKKTSKKWIPANRPGSLPKKVRTMKAVFMDNGDVHVSGFPDDYRDAWRLWSDAFMVAMEHFMKGPFKTMVSGPAKRHEKDVEAGETGPCMKH